MFIIGKTKYYFQDCHLRKLQTNTSDEKIHVLKPVSYMKVGFLRKTDHENRKRLTLRVMDSVINKYAQSIHARVSGIKRRLHETVYMYSISRNC